MAEKEGVWWAQGVEDVLVVAAFGGEEAMRAGVEGVLGWGERIVLLSGLEGVSGLVVMGTEGCFTARFRIEWVEACKRGLTLPLVTLIVELRI